MQKNTKNILLTAAGVGLLALYVNRPQTESASSALKGKPLFEVAESLETPNKVQRSPIEDQGTVAALDQRETNSEGATASLAQSAKPDEAPANKTQEANSGKSLWDAAENPPTSGSNASTSISVSHDKGSDSAAQRQASSKSSEELKNKSPRAQSNPSAHPTAQLVTTAGSSTREEMQPKPESPATNSSRRAGTSSMSDLISMSASSTTKVSGRDTMAMGNLLQEGSSYLGILEDPIRVTEGEPQPCTILMLGKLSNNTVDVPFKMTGMANLNKDKTKVCIEVKRCVDSRPSSRAVDCYGNVGDIEGWNCISGVINSPGIWGTIIRTASIIGSQMSLSKMTSSVTQSGVLMDETQSNAILESLSVAYRALGNEIADKIESKGTSISISGQSIVRVRITKDTPLW
jgi:hypothetical protein